MGVLGPKWRGLKWATAMAANETSNRFSTQLLPLSINEESLSHSCRHLSTEGLGHPLVLGSAPGGVGRGGPNRAIPTWPHWRRAAQSKSSDEVVVALQHFVAPDDAVEVIYTDNSRELIAGIKELGYRHQTSVEYVDSSKSFIEREVRNMLEGARTNLVQSGMPLQYWPLAIQHFAMATNTSDQLDSSPSPWELRFGEMFEGMAIPFGAKVLFWNNPNRADNTAGKLSPTSVEGVFLGYHVQPGHK